MYQIVKAVHHEESVTIGREGIKMTVKGDLTPKECLLTVGCRGHEPLVYIQARELKPDSYPKIIAAMELMLIQLKTFVKDAIIADKAFHDALLQAATPEPVVTGEVKQKPEAFVKDSGLPTTRITDTLKKSTIVGAKK